MKILFTLVMNIMKILMTLCFLLDVFQKKLISSFHKKLMVFLDWEWAQDWELMFMSLYIKLWKHKILLIELFLTSVSERMEDSFRLVDIIKTYFFKNLYGLKWLKLIKVKATILTFMVSPLVVALSQEVKNGIRDSWILEQLSHISLLKCGTK